MLPQKPYVPSGTLRRAIAYPGGAEDWTLDKLLKLTQDAVTFAVREGVPVVSCQPLGGALEAAYLELTQ